MKRQFITQKTILSAILLIGFALSSLAQDWTTDKANLYYVGSDGKVFIEADFDAMAIYFKNDQVSDEVRQKFAQKVSRLKSATTDFELMNKKGMLRIKKAESLNPINTPQEREAFLENYDLEREGAYDVLPAFWVSDKQAWFTKRVTIRLEAGVTLQDISATLDKYDATFIKNVVNSNTYLLRVEKIQNQLPLIQELNSQNVLVWGEPDFKVDLVKSFDPMYGDSWHLNNVGGTLDGKTLIADTDVNAPEAWAVTTGSSNVVVAVIDDGVEAHEDMPALLPGYTPVDGGDGTPSLAGDGHGQQVAGLISAQHNNIGAMGIAPDANTFSINIFAPNTTNADVADGITWAVNNGADILSNSWGFGSCTYNVAAITDAFAYAATDGRNGKGCVILIASGNDFQSCVSYPANLPTVTAVGGISGDGERSMFSNYGPALDIVAPSDDDWRRRGRQYYSTGTHGLRTIDREGSNGWYSGNYSESFGGTSGATPQVSAVAALVLSVDANLSKAEVENILYSSAKNVGDENQYGAGLVDAYAAVIAAGGTGVEDTEAPTAPSGLIASNITTNSFTLAWTASSDNIGVSGYDVFQNGQVIGSTANTSYNVSGLNASTTYIYTVTAKDAAGNVSAASGSLNVTTNDVGPDLAMTSSINLTAQTKGPNTTASATITVMSGGSPVANAQVSISWGGDASGSNSGTTAGDGTIRFNSSKVRNATSFNITINDITATGYFWDTDNSETTATLLKSGSISGSSNALAAFKAYPNPVNNGFLTISLPEINEHVQALIYDMSGKLKVQKQLTNINNVIGVDNLKPGIYILRVEGLAELQTKKIIVK